MKLLEWLGNLCGSASPDEDDEAVEIPSLRPQRSGRSSNQPATATMPAGVVQPQSVTLEPQNPLVGPPSSRPLSIASSRAVHRLHGAMNIERRVKAANEKSVTFDLNLTSPKYSEKHTFFHTMYVSDEDDAVGASSLGYIIIDFPDEMTGRGIGYFYHYVAALAARDLDVEYIVIESAVSEPMQRLCYGLRMTETVGAFVGRPETIIEAAKLKLAQKGWVLEEAAA